MYSQLFWLGEIGLLLVAVFSMGILQQSSVAEDRPQWFYFVAMWLVTIGAVFALVEPIGNPQARNYENTAYIIRFLFGLERTAVFAKNRYKYGSIMPSLLIRRINTYIIILSVLVIFGGAGYGAYQVLSEKVDTLQDEAFSADSIAVKAGRLLVIETNRQRADDRQKIIQLQLSNDHLTKQVERVTRLLVIQNEEFVKMKMNNQRLLIQMQKQGELLRRQSPALPLLRGRSSMVGDNDAAYYARVQSDSVYTN